MMDPQRTTIVIRSICCELQILVAKAFLSAFKFEYLIQDIREGEGSALADHDGAEVTMNAFKVADDGTLSAPPDVKLSASISPHPISENILV